jgi:hypothetical protein
MYKYTGALYTSLQFNLRQGCEKRVSGGFLFKKMKMSKSTNPDLEVERKKCTFNTLELTHLLDGGAQKTEERHSRGMNFALL